MSVQGKSSPTQHQMIFNSAVVSAATILTLATAARIPTKTQVPKDPTEGLDGGKVEAFLAELDERTPGETLAAMTSGCDRVNLALVQRVPQFINHINGACFAAVLKADEKAAMFMLQKVETAGAADEVFQRLGPSLGTIDEAKLAGVSTVLSQRVKKGTTEDKAEPPNSGAAFSSKASAALIAVAGLFMLL